MNDYLFIFYSYIGIISVTNIYSLSNHKPIHIDKNLISFYNIFNSLTNLYVVYGLSKYVLNTTVGLYIPCDETFKYYIYIHYLCKYLDFFDTILMILRHKWEQVHFLQLFHHSTIGIVWYWILKDGPTHSAMIGSGAFANSFIHFLMYLHYFTTNIGIKNPFKSLMTSLQMFQFTICIVVACIWCYQFPKYIIFGLVQIGYMSVMLLLFYYYVYQNKKINNIHKNNENIKNENIKNEKSIILRINNNEYDVSNFIKKHPGGNIIEQYDINNVSDATNAYNTFHFHSIHANKLLQTLPIRKKSSIEKQMPNDFQDLINQWKNKGLFNNNNSIISFIIWASIIFGITLSGFICLYMNNPILGGVIVGIGWTHCGFVQHHAGHLAFTGKPQIDYVVQSIFECLLKGGSARWWRNRHNKHHAMPNSIEHDGDLRTTPFFAWDDVLIKKVPTFLLRFQHLLFIPLLSLYVPVFFFTTKLYLIRKKYWDELGLILIHFILSSYFYTSLYNCIIFYTLGYSIQGVYLGVMFGLNHFAMPRVNDCSNDWFRWQLLTTCNWGIGSLYSQYISGFLNLQIEHHIVPQMPAENYSKIVDDIKQYAFKHNIPYIELTFFQGFYNMINTLKITGEKELLRRKSLKK
jgi:fatty acid desaturase 2 (delta-6 desaturase)